MNILLRFLSKIITLNEYFILFFVVEKSNMSVDVTDIINTGRPVYIKSALGNAYLHLYGAHASNGGKISTWELVNQPNLKWLINSTDGGYYISTLVDPNFVVHQHGSTCDNGGAITTWDRRTAPNDANLKVNFERGHDGFYMIRFLHSGKCVHVHGAKTENNTPITQWDCVNQANLKWEFQYA
jgi:hypothetical protein